MNWRPLGLVFRTDCWAQCPTPLVMEDRTRVYFSSRDVVGKSFVRFVDLDLDDPTKIIDESKEVVLKNGEPGTFDDEGQIPSFARRDNGKIVLWYSGWNTRNTIPYHNAAGFAVSENGGRTFKRIQDGPVLDRTPQEPYLAVTPCFDGQDIYYISGKWWERFGSKYEPIYGICHAILTAQGNVVRDGKPVIPGAHQLECFSRPWIMRRKGELVLFYCYRSADDYRDGKNAYNLGCAFSYNNGLDWHRRDTKMERERLREDWNATMMCYPALFEANGKTYMLFNGNGFGKHGFGLAICE